MDRLIKAIIILPFFLILSCGKSRIIKIKAKDALNNQPYAGLSYTIVSSRTAADGEKYRTEASGTLDANGEAMEEIRQKKGRSYSVRIGKPNGEICYHNELNQYFDSPFDANGTFYISSLPTCAYLKLHIIYNIIALV
jgi:hypothetical protein